MATVITKEGDSIITTIDGEVTNVQSIRREDNVISVTPSASYEEVFNIVREVATGNIIVFYDSDSVTIEPTNLTGAEIVALLEALGLGGRLSHTKLDDVGASDHHAQSHGLDSHSSATLANLNADISDATLVGAAAITSEIDGDVSTHAAIKSANATLGHVIVETGSSIDVDGNGKIVLGDISAFLESTPSDNESGKAPDSNWAHDHGANTTTAHGAVSAATASKHVVRDASARAKFAAPGASGDALIQGTRVTTAELPAMTDEKIWKGTGTNVEEVDVYTDAAAVSAIETADPTFGKRIMYIKVLANDTALTTGDGKAYITIPIELNGMNLILAHAAVYTTSSGAAPAVSLERSTDFGSGWDDMLSTGITIDATEYSSYTAGTLPVIDGAKDDVATGNWIRVNVDTAGTGTKGLDVILTFQLP